MTQGKIKGGSRSQDPGPEPARDRKGQHLAKRLLLISSSFHQRGGYLDHAEGELKIFLAGVKRVLFFPFAVRDHIGYTNITKTRFSRIRDIRSSQRTS